MMRVLMLVNGAVESAAAVRARDLAASSRKAWTFDFAYRPIPKWRGIVQFLRKAFVTKPDLIYIMDTAYAGVIAGICYKFVSGCPVVLDTGDTAYDLAHSTGNYSTLEMALIWAIEQIALYGSNAVIVRGSYHRELLLQSGVRRVEFIPDGVRPMTISQRDRDEAESLRHQLGFRGSLIIGMVGRMIWSERHEMCYGWDIVEAIALLKDCDVKALLVGDGDGRMRLERRTSELGISDRIRFVGKVEPAQLLPYLLIMDVCVSTQSNDVVGWVRTTGKLPLYLAAGRYVVASDVGEAHRVLPEIGCLLPYNGVRDEAHPRRLAAHIREVAANPKILKRAEGCPAVVAREFDYGVLSERMCNLLSEVVAQRKAG